MKRSEESKSGLSKTKSNTNKIESRKNNDAGVELQDELLGVQLRHLGLQLRDIPGDGNCLFRALCDQLEGNQENHRRHRVATVNYMIEKRKDFEPFVEDDTTFDDYVNDLRMDGTYAGNDAIVAFAKNNQVDIVIHQLNTRMWTINGGKKDEKRRQLHIAYLNGDHYASVRRLNDRMESPSNIRLISKKKSSSQRNLKDAIKKIEKATGCQDERFIQEMLEECDNNEEYAISTILQIQKKSKGKNNTPSVSSSTKVFVTKKLSSPQSDKLSTKKQRKKDAKRQKKLRAFERKKSELLRKENESSSSQSEDDTSSEVVFDKMESLKI